MSIHSNSNSDNSDNENCINRFPDSNESESDISELHYQVQDQNFVKIQDSKIKNLNKGIEHACLYVLYKVVFL